MYAPARTAFFFASLLVLLLCYMPLMVHAQTPSDLRATIRAELLSDPRTSGLSSTQLDAMVDLLTKEADSRGITAQDITWRPQQNEAPQSAAVPTAEACTSSRFLCMFNDAFGFSGGSAVPLILGGAAIGLVWILAEMIRGHRRMMPPTV